MTLETGTNLTGLGYTFLLLKYLLPYIFGLILLGVSAILGFAIYQRIKGENLTKEQILLSIVGAGLIALLFIR